jgi:hypothetical protein
LEKSFINNLNSKESEIIQEVLLRFTVKISNFLIQYQDPKRFAEFCANRIDKKNFHVTRRFFANLSNLNSKKLYTQMDLKTIISLDNIPDSIISKVRRDFENRGWIENIRDKNKIKDFRTNEFNAKGEKNTYKTAGRISFFEKTPKLDKVIEILSKPGAIEYIICMVSKYDKSLIDNFLKFTIISLFHMLPHYGESLEIYLKELSYFYKNFQLDFNKSEHELNNILPYLSEEQLEIVAEQIAEAFKQKFGYTIIIYLLSLWHIR